MYKLTKSISGMKNLNKINKDIKIEDIACTEEIHSPKVSVIVPTYNNENYISKCLISLIQQTLKEIEIIIVDDGSDDNTLSLLDSFKVDTRIRVLTQEHKKQGAARNFGMNNARGEYIGFVDSDDWVDTDFYEKLYTAAKKYDSDIALATNVRIGNGKTKKRLNILKEEFVTTLQDKIDIGKQPKNPCPTNKIYRLDMLKNNSITWPEGVFCEDKLFTIKAVYYSNGIVSVPDVNYYYYRNPDSTVKSKKRSHSEKYIKDKRSANLAVLNFLKENNAQIRDKDFWAITDEKRLFGIPLYVKKESLHTIEHRLFSLIPYKREVV